MLNLRRFTTVLSTVIVTAVVAGCGDQPVDARAENPAKKPEKGAPVPVGARCTIQFRRDALGGNMQNPISPTTSSINGASVSLSGKLKAVNSEWVVIKRGSKENWVPRDMVLMIEFVK